MTPRPQQEVLMQGFEWAEGNLGVRTPYDLESRGVTVYFAPHISPDTKVVDLSDGHVESFAGEEKRPTTGYFADFGSLEKFCRENGSHFTETNGSVTLQTS
jgi:hypothetical protein